MIDNELFGADAEKTNGDANSQSNQVAKLQTYGKGLHDLFI